ncbi:Protein kinase family protein [Rhynchospora pubera]|uniref:Receptor kinase-like protein Xa21 n=1 Tax=Rhynchospora pubera TaxID=906938 RepID=A0AAV8DKV3_9POAL|nr:Protein kinase family protein [Rhynchospora pubera]
MIGGNKISGTIPIELGNLTNLNTLYMDRNLLAGRIPPAIGNLTKLVILSLSTNNLSGPIPSSLGNLDQLNEIYLDANQLTDSIPKSLGNCIHLNKANFSCNNLKGRIPKELFSIASFTLALDLSHNSLTGPIPLEVGKLINLGVLNLSHNYFRSNIPTSLGNCLLLEHLHMEGNLLEGRITNSFANLKGLKEVDLSLNNLSGNIPNFFESFDSLYYLNLSYNNFDGPVPIDGLFSNKTEVFIQGNDKLCAKDPNLFLQVSPCLAHNSTRTSNSHLVRTILMIIAGIIVIISLVVSCLLLFWRKAHKTQLSTDHAKEKFRKVTYADLDKATDGFSPRNLVGRGRFGSVYKGKLEFEVNPVAIKVFNLDLRGGLKSFTTECDALRNLRHRNLVRVITSCSTINPFRNDFRALVFEYMPNGNLEKWLHPKSTSETLTLAQRICIASDVASSLEYLHDGCGNSIVHCDVKPSNILLDHAMTAHVTDFGIAEFLVCTTEKSKNSSSLSGLRGSIGYIAPEYGMGGRASTAGDVYSFGVLLLEMLTGKRPTDEIFKEGLSLPSFVNEAFPERIMEIVDSAILGQESEVESEPSDHRNIRSVIQLIKVALLCTVELPKHRIKMRQVASEIAYIWQVFSN